MKNLRLHTLLILFIIPYSINSQDYGESVILTTYDYLYSTPHRHIVTPDYNSRC